MTPKLEKIKKQFKEVITYSQDIPEPQVDELFDNWLEAKKDFIEIFDGKLIYEYPVPISFNLDEKAKQSHLNEFVEVILTQYNNEPLAEFIESNAESFYDNIVSVTSTHKIPKGMKLVKAFKYFDDNKRSLEDIQNMASQLIQENKITGNLCFSVHPLDFLSVSENTYNWRSCHALDGEYRAGNLSYMQDKSTVICYIKGADNVQIPMFPDSVPWNSKKWRVLFYLSENWDIIFSGRQYPFSSMSGLEDVRRIFLNILRKDAFSYCTWTDPVFKEIEDSYGHEYSTLTPYIVMRGEVKKLTDIVIDAPEPLHFNDLLHSSCYRPHFTAYRNVPWYSPYTDMVYVGHGCNCLRCGEHPIDVPDSMMCCKCELEYGSSDNGTYGSCDCCGSRIVREDAYWVGDDQVCEDCFRQYCFVCENCDEAFYIQDRIYKKDAHGDEWYVCPECAKEFEEEEE